jgi:hypothetical protein
MDKIRQTGELVKIEDHNAANNKRAFLAYCCHTMVTRTRKQRNRNDRKSFPYSGMKESEVASNQQVQVAMQARDCAADHMRWQLEYFNCRIATVLERTFTADPIKRNETSGRSTVREQ